MPILSSDPSYFWGKVAKSGRCWEWRGYKKNGRYGNLQVRKVTYQSHVYAYMLAHKLDSKPTLCVLHSCDNPACVRPDHLFLGTPKDNYLDMVKKGRNKNFYSAETAKKRWASRSRKPEDHPMFGKKHTPQALAKMRRGPCKF